MILTARVVPTDDFSFAIAVELPQGNKYRHYKVPGQFVAFMLGEMNGDNAKEFAINAVRDRVKQDFGPDTDIGLIEGNEVDEQWSGHASRHIIPLPEGIFSPKVITALKQRQSKALIYEYEQNMSMLPDRVARVRDYLALRLLSTPIHYLNQLIGKANRGLQKLYGIDGIWDDAQKLWADCSPSFEFYTEDYTAAYGKYEAAAKGKFFIPFFTVYSSFYRFTKPCAYLARMAAEENIESAVEVVSKDLDVMADLGLIFGNLSMPRVVELNNVVGNGKRIYAAFAFPILDTDKLASLLGLKSLNDLKMSYVDALRGLGVGTAVHEGETTGEYPYKDQIESVVLIEGPIEARRAERQADTQKVLENAYLAQKEAEREMMARKIKEVQGLTKKD